MNAIYNMLLMLAIKAQYVKYFRKFVKLVFHE